MFVALPVLSVLLFSLSTSMIHICMCAYVCLCVAIEFCQVRHEKGLCKVKSEKETDKPRTHLITRILWHTHTHIHFWFWWASRTAATLSVSFSLSLPFFFASVLLAFSSHICITRHLRLSVLCIQNRQGNNNNSLATASAMHIHTHMHM